MTGEMHAQHKEIKEATVQAVRAREELTRAGVCDEFAQRLAALEAAISTTSQALHLHNKALAEMEAASRSVEQAQARPASQCLRIRRAWCLHEVHIGTDLPNAGQRRQGAGENCETACSKRARSSCPVWERRNIDGSMAGSGFQGERS